MLAAIASKRFGALLVVTAMALVPRVAMAADPEPTPTAPIAEPPPIPANDGGGLPPELPPEPGLAEEARNLEWVGFQQFADLSRVFVRTTEPVTYTLDESRPDSVGLLLDNTRIATRNHGRFLDARFFEGPVWFIRPKLIEGPSSSVRIEIKTRRKVAYTVSQKDNQIYIDFPRE